jgi:hypothetical protein
MKREKEGRKAEKSGGGMGRAGRALHPLVVMSLTSTAAANGRGPSWLEEGPAREASISVWWEYPPAGDDDGDHGRDRKQPSRRSRP